MAQAGADVVEMILPENVVEVPSPTVSVAAVLLSSTVPEPASEPMVLSKPFRSSVPSTVKAEVEANAVVEPACSVPLLIVVAPV